MGLLIVPPLYFNINLRSDEDKWRDSFIKFVVVDRSLSTTAAHVLEQRLCKALSVQQNNSTAVISGQISTNLVALFVSRSKRRDHPLIKLTYFWLFWISTFLALCSPGELD